MCATTLRAEDLTDEEPASVVKLPVTGLTAPCCDTAVKKAMAELKGADSVAVATSAAGKTVVITVKKGVTLDLSAIADAMAKANEAMGKAMGTVYKVDEGAILVGDGVAFKIPSISVAGKNHLDAALEQVKGYGASKVEGIDKDNSLLSIVFDPEQAPTLDGARKILKDAKIEVKDVVFRGVEDEGEAAVKSYTCPMCGGDFAKPGDCPKCGMALVEKDKDAPPPKQGGC